MAGITTLWTPSDILNHPKKFDFLLIFLEHEGIVFFDRIVKSVIYEITIQFHFRF